MSTIAVTPGSGKNIQTYQDVSQVDHPAGVMEFLVSAVPTPVSATAPLPIVVQGNGTGAPIYVSPGSGAKFDVVPQSPVPTGYLPVRLSDGTSFYTASGGAGGGSGQQYAEDAAHTSGDLGTVALAVRKDTATQLAGTDGDYSVLLTDSTGRLHVNVGNTVAVSGTFFQATQPVSLASQPLPTGASTEATLATVAGKDFATQATLSALNAKVPSLGQAVAGSSTPVVLPAAQITTLTPPAAITGFATETSLAAMSGKLPAALGQAVAANSLSVIIASNQTSIPTAATPQAGTSGGWTPSHALTAASTNATSLKASAGQVGGWVFSNTNAATRYVKFFNKASAPTVGTDTPVFVVAVPGGSTAAPTVVTLNNTAGIAFATGIAYAVTGGIADTDATSVTAGDMSVDILYK